MKYIVSLSLILISWHTRAQDADSSLHKFEPKEITIKLSPIIMERGKYYYEGKRVRFEEVVMPLMATNDDIVDKRLRLIHTMTDARRLIYYAELGYTLYLISNAATTSGNQVFATFIGFVILNELYNLSILLAQKKAVDRYNDVVLQPSFSLGQRGTPLLGFRIRF
jgi:hypothetical protein